jgi:dTDP-glucose pyrophosphorylase
MCSIDIEEIMISPDTSLMDAVKVMNSTSMQILLVIDETRRLLGVVTDGDIRRALIEQISFDNLIEKIMNRSPIVIHSPVIKKKALDLMKEHAIKHIPVLSEDEKLEDLVLWKDFFNNGDISFKPKSNKVVIMAGGKGTRLDLFTKILPKPLIPVGDKPIIEHVINNFSRYGFNDFIISLNYKSEMIRLYFSDNNHGNSISYVEEEKFLGTAGSLSLCKESIEDTFFVSNCDVITDANLDNLFNYHSENKNHATILGTVRNVKIPYGVLESDKSDLETIIEKPEYHFVINSGIYALEPEILELLPRNDPIHMTDLLLEAKSRGMKIQVYPMTCSWFDVGEWGEYKRAIEHINSIIISN